MSWDIWKLLSLYKLSCSQKIRQLQYIFLEIGIWLMSVFSDFFQAAVEVKAPLFLYQIMNGGRYHVSRLNGSIGGTETA